MTTLNAMPAATFSGTAATALLQALPEIQAEAGVSSANLSYAELDERMRNALARIVSLVHWLNAGGHHDVSVTMDTPRTTEIADVQSNDAVNLSDAKISMLRFAEGGGHDTYNFSGDMKSSTIILEGNLAVNDVLHIRSKKLVNVSFVGGRESITIDYSGAELDPAGAFINIVTRPDDRRTPISLKL